MKERLCDCCGLLFLEDADERPLSLEHFPVGIAFTSSFSHTREHLLYATVDGGTSFFNVEYYEELQPRFKVIKTRWKLKNI